MASRKSVNVLLPFVVFVIVEIAFPVASIRTGLPSAPIANAVPSALSVVVVSAVMVTENLAFPVIFCYNRKRENIV